MATPSVQWKQTTVVLLGSFNPRIFEPLWLAKNELVAQAEADDAEVRLIDNDFCQLQLPWLDMVVLDERMQISTTDETVNDGQIRDLVVGILRLLPHTPVQQGSIHHRSEVQLSSVDQWHEVGHRLAPKEIWDGILDQPGMFDFAMSGVRPDGEKGAIKVRIRPSQDFHPGIFMNVNDEFLPPGEGRALADFFFDLWPEAESRADEIRSELLARLVD